MQPQYDKSLSALILAKPKCLGLVRSCALKRFTTLRLHRCILGNLVDFLCFVWSFNAHAGYCLSNAGYYFSANTGNFCSKSNASSRIQPKTSNNLACTYSFKCSITATSISILLYFLVLIGGEVFKNQFARISLCFLQQNHTALHQ